MIHVGIDAVEIARFKNWHRFSIKKLNRIFTAQEIAYCLNTQGKEAERFAARFAIKEALYKALSSYVEFPPPFLTVCRSSELGKKANGSPFLCVDWPALHSLPLEVSCSLTHTQTIAIALVILTTM